MKGWKAQVSLRTMLSVPTPMPLQHYQLCVPAWFNNYQIQILKEEKDKRAAANTPPYTIKFTIDWPSNPNLEKGKMQKVSLFPVSSLQFNCS